MLVRGGSRHHELHCGTGSVCVEGTALAGGWVSRRRRRVTGRRWAGKRRIELSLNVFFGFSEMSTASCVEYSVFWDGGEGEPIGFECQREQVRAGKRRVEFSLNENFVFQISNASCVEHFVFWDRGRGEPIGIECQREQVRRSGPSELRR